MDATENTAANAGNADGTGTNVDLRTIQKTLPQNSPTCRVRLNG